MTAAAPFNKVLVVGVGLIGGSLALALRRAGLAPHLVGFDANPEALRQAIALGVIDEATSDWASACRGTSLVVLATPVRQIEQSFEQLAPHLQADTLITDVGSTKQNIIAAAKKHLHRHVERWVPGHPIAGLEKSGVQAASAELFKNRPVIITPLDTTAAWAQQRVAALWEACGATVSFLSPLAHDDIFATVSHLPHVLAFALMRQVQCSSNASELLSHAGTSFHDVTRIAQSSPEMWSEIFVANRELVLRRVTEFETQLELFRHILEANDSDTLLAFLGG